MGWICLSSVCEASRPMMRKRRQLAHLPNVSLLFVQRNSRKRGPWNYNLTCCLVLTQLLVPKTTRENVKNLRRLTRLPLPQTRTKPKSPPMLLGYGLSCLTDRSDRHKNLLLAANLNSLTRSGKKNRTNNFLYPARQHLRLSGHIFIRLLNRRNTKSGVQYCPE